MFSFTFPSPDLCVLVPSMKKAVSWTFGIKKLSRRIGRFLFVNRIRLQFSEFRTIKLGLVLCTQEFPKSPLVLPVEHMDWTGHSSQMGLLDLHTRAPRSSSA